MIMRCHIQVAYDILALEFHICRPRDEVYFASINARKETFLSSTTCLVTHALFEIALVLEHRLLTVDLHSAAAVGRVRVQPGVWIGHRHAWRRGGVFGRSHADIRE